MNITKKANKQPGKIKHEDDMIQEITVTNNKVSDLPLLDGTYTVIVLSNKERTRKEWQMYYYAIIDEFCKDTGNTRTEIHRMFKEEYGIESTTTLEEHRWPVVVNELKKWCLLNG